MMRRTGVTAMSLLMKQMEMHAPLTENDRHVESWSDEFMKPPQSQEMKNKYGQYAKYSNPAFAKVDTSDEVALNTYPEGCPKGRLEWTGHDLKTYHAGFYDEAFFRKNILKPQLSEELEDKVRVTDYALNTVLLGCGIFAVRYLVAPLWWIGQPRMQLVAESNIEAEIGQLEFKECKTVVWRGKPVYVYRRSPKQLQQMVDTPLSALKHPETDEERFPENREMCICIAICTHLGCIPAPNEGIYNGFFCPCHGSHYDVSGRIRQGPAPLNLEVPPYRWIDADTVYLGK